MNSRQRLCAALVGEPMDRVPITEIGVWPETRRRWLAEGLPPDVSIEEHFELDKFHFFSFDGSLMLPTDMVEETDEFRVATDGDGNTYQYWKDRQAAPMLLSSLITTSEKWDEMKGNLEPDFQRFSAFRSDVIFGGEKDEEQEEYYRRVKEEDGFTVLVPTEPCWYYIRLLGEEEALVHMALEPEFAGQVMRDYTEFNIQMIQKILDNGYSFDAMWVFSDMCYKNGMLFSPMFYKKVVLPCQKRLFAFAKEHGMRVIYHSDGDVHDLIPLLIEAGVDCMQPLEARAGNDVREYLEKYGDRMSFIGNINADAMAGTKEDIYAEISTKVPCAKQYNRYIYHSDHSIPDTVSFENFSYAIQLARQFGVY